MLSAIILAAGASERMGFPKALLLCEGRTFLETIVAACRQAGLSRLIVVLGPDRDRVEAAVDLGGATIIANPEPATGPLTSLKLALATVLNCSVEGALVWHVDRPHVSVGTVQTLVRRFMVDRPAVVLPEYRGQRGHPVIFGRRVFGELMDAPAAVGARAVVRADRARVVAVPVEDSAVVENIDTPEDYRDLLGRATREPASPQPPESRRS